MKHSNELSTQKSPKTNKRCQNKSTGSTGTIRATGRVPKFRIDKNTSTIHLTQNEPPVNHNTYHITWPSRPIRISAFMKVFKWAKHSRDYSAKYDNLNKFAKTFNDLSCDQIQSIRSAVVKEKIIFGYQRMNNQIAHIAAEYNTVASFISSECNDKNLTNSGGVNILDLSTKYDFPPLNLLRGILIQNGMNKTTAYKIFAEKDTSIVSSALSGRDFEQYILAKEHDAESIFNQFMIDKIAQENEDRFVKYFKSVGIQLVDQNQLVKEQIAEHGRAILTPDILFLDTVYINGVLIKWIDYKDYAGTPIKFLYNSNKEQAAKYYARWGTGAICYHQSFVDSMELPGAIMLDVRSLPIKLSPPINIVSTINTVIPTDTINTSSTTEVTIDS